MRWNGAGRIHIARSCQVVSRATTASPAAAFVVVAIAVEIEERHHTYCFARITTAASRWPADANYSKPDAEDMTA